MYLYTSTDTYLIHMDIPRYKSDLSLRMHSFTITYLKIHGSIIIYKFRCMYQYIFLYMYIYRCTCIYTFM